MEGAENAMEYTLTEAAEATGLGRTTLHRAIKSGRLSARREEDGSYRIDGAELARVYPPKSMERPLPSPWKAEEQSGKGEEGAGTGDGVTVAVLRAQLEAMTGQLERERADREHERATAERTAEDLRKRLDQEQEERRTLQRRLMPPIPAATPEIAQESSKAPEVVMPSPAPRRGLLGRLLGR